MESIDSSKKDNEDPLIEEISSTEEELFNQILMNERDENNKNLNVNKI